MTQWHQTITRLEHSREPYVLITLLGARGSTPRDAGTKMVVTAHKSFHTIGGGHLEYQAIASARQLLAEGHNQQKIEHFPLGAKLGQCCGGSTSVLFECFAGAQLNIMLFGAGHVGKALSSILAQLPCRLYWVDSREEEFPEQLPENVIKIVSDSPAAEVADMPANSYFVVMTHNHPLDFEITDAVLKRGDARYIGLIGSQTKWQRFKMRFEHRDHQPDYYAAVRCPVGLSAVPGKLPMEVAVSVAGEIIGEYQRDLPPRPTQQGASWRELKQLLPADKLPADRPETSTETQDN